MDYKLVVVVGSKNPIKVGAVDKVLCEAVAGGLLPGVKQAEVVGQLAASGVSDQPVGDEETRQGAAARARAALLACSEAAWGVGIEGGVVRLDSGYHTCAWCVIVDRQDNFSSGGGLYMPLPPVIARDLDAGLELGDATDRLFGVTGSKQAGGALGYLSKNLRSRQSAYETIFTYALVKFLNPEMYELN